LKKKQIFVLGSLGKDVTSEGVSFFCPSLRGPGRQSNEPFFSLKFFLETRLSSESLKPLLGFLAYLNPKLCHENQKVVQLFTPSKTNLGWITPSWYMAITRRQIS